MLLRYAAEVGNVELLKELPKPAYKDDWKARHGQRCEGW
jgi:hypothetical protein